MTRYTARAAAWYTAAYRRLEAAEVGPYDGAGHLARYCWAEDMGRAYDARAAIAARYARMVSL